MLLALSVVEQIDLEHGQRLGERIQVVIHSLLTQAGVFADAVRRDRGAVDLESRDSVYEQEF